MRWALQSGKVDERSPLPPEYDTWQLVKLTGWTLDQIDNTPGHFLDWALAFIGEEARVARERANGA